MLQRTIAVIAAVSMTVGLLAAPARAKPSARVFVVRAIPNLVNAKNLNLCMNGIRKLSTFGPGSVAGPFTIHAGRVHVKLTRDQAPCRSTDPKHVILATSFKEPSGSKSTLVAGLHPNGGHFDHRCATGECAFTKYKNVGARTERGSSRINVVHVADTGASPVDSAVNVSFRGRRRVRGLRNNGHASPPLDLRRGPLRWSVSGAAGTTKAGQLLASGMFAAKKGHAYTLILWGPQNGRYHVKLMDREVGAPK
jgi:hypothetical protein